MMMFQKDRNGVQNDDTEINLIDT